uniref:Uncharacterized protein n=1 Tax=Anguilla anguilla TaxID=7936 RepID=A0A0E9W907_ANGAN
MSVCLYSGEKRSRRSTSSWVQHITAASQSQSTVVPGNRVPFQSFQNPGMNPAGFLLKRVTGSSTIVHLQKLPNKKDLPSLQSRQTER